MSEVKTIILIDDDRTSNFLNRKIIKASYPLFEVLDFIDTAESIEYLDGAQNQEKKVDLIILDINMPEIDGWEFIMELRNRNIRSFKNIVLLSSTIDENDIEKIKKFGEISAFLSKPLKLELIKQYLM